ncbi:tyrosine-type recombinase/integrase [Saccharospirillum sp.]|uniref:tyrosine-type recombinase/integrase n=1 Tax=Saccharospirillum sp. TaxID=2033801 RepID=UPI00349FF9BD
MFRDFLKQEVGDLDFKQAKKHRKLPTVLSPDEAKRVISQLTGLHRLIVQLMYGSGLRIMEAVRLRVKDVDFENGGLWIQEAKGGKARRSLLPNRTIPMLKEQVEHVFNLHASDLETGHGRKFWGTLLLRRPRYTPTLWACMREVW